MILRSIAATILEQVGKYSVIIVTGPRQSGKTTLIRSLFPDFPYFSLESPDVRDRIEQDPRGLFLQYGHKLVLDEIQRLPSLLSYIQGIVDEDREACFVLSGSQNILMMESVSQTLAGRATLFSLLPLSYAELSSELPTDVGATEVMWRGGYPRIYDRELAPERFYQDYLATYVERDVRQVKNIGDLGAFTRFLSICAGFIGQTITKSTLASAAGVTTATVASWLSVLETSYVVYQLQPYYKNFKKRLVKSPKLYFRDTGLACALLGIRSSEALHTYYQRGAIFENFIVNEVAKAYYNRGATPPLFYWRDSHQHEIDLLINHGTALQPIEIKSGATFRQDFFKQLDWFAGVANVPLVRPTVIYGGVANWKIASGEVASWQEVEGVIYPPPSLY